MPEGRSPPFAYTIGLHEQGLPELLMVGLPMETAHTLIMDTFTCDLCFRIDMRIPIGHDRGHRGLRKSGPDAPCSQAATRIVGAQWFFPQGRVPV
jgi:Domain of unknown function (DUF4262)